MARTNWFKADKYTGVYYREVPTPDDRATERSYYITYRRGGRNSKVIEEPVGTSGKGMTPAKASLIRARRINGEESNTERRERKQTEAKEARAAATITDLWELYFKTHASNKSIRDDKNRFTKHVEPTLGAMEAAKLTTRDITALRDRLEKYGLSPQSVKHCLGLVKRILLYADSQEYIQCPRLRFDMPQFDNRKTETMTEDQLAAYWRALDAEPDQNVAAILRFALVTGMRRGAIFALKWCDVDLEAGFVTLRAAAAKNGKTARIPINEEAIKILAALPRISDYVFPGQGGGQRKSVQKISTRVRNRAGLPKDFRPMHGLRHSFASALVSNGASLYEAQALLTHSNPTMTQRYDHLADEALRKAANLGNALADKQGQ